MLASGASVESSSPLTITPNVPNITAFSAALLGQKLTLTETNMDVVDDIFFLGDILATKYGAKTSTTIEVFVPDKTTLGTGKIKFVTDKNEIYWSPDIVFKAAAALKLTAFNESLASPWSLWGWVVQQIWQILNKQDKVLYL